MKFFLLFIFFVQIFTQLYDYCSNEDLLSTDREKCLSIVGCCYVVLEGSSGGASPTSLENINSCFKKFKKEKGKTCEDYRTITSLSPNNVSTCECNEDELSNNK
jgi:hypothetical protein